MTWPLGYACAPALRASYGRYALRPIDWADRGPVRTWRNAQIDVLRQQEPLTEADQDRYYSDVVEPQMSMAQPPQVLVAVTEDGALIGYGGVVHINWAGLQGEVSFLTDPARLAPATFTADWRAYLAMLLPTARDVLGLRRLTTEAYPSRTDLFPLLEEAGFTREPPAEDDDMVRHTLDL